jgi:hypothetical protein
VVAEACAAQGATLCVAVIVCPQTHPSIIDATLGMRTPEQVGRNVNSMIGKSLTGSGMISAIRG